MTTGKAQCQFTHYAISYVLIVLKLILTAPA